MPGSQSCCSALVLRLSVPRTVFCFHDVSTRVSRYAISWMSLRRFWIRMRFLTLAADGCRGRSDKQHPRAALHVILRAELAWVWTKVAQTKPGLDCTPYPDH